MAAPWPYLLVLGAAVACTDSPASTWDQVGSDLIYGEDDRVEAHAAPNELLRHRALHSAVALLSASALRPTPEGGFEVHAKPLGEAANLCPDEPFREQPTAAICSGVLVDDALVLTAGHCAGSVAPCADQLWVFQYALTSDGSLSPLTNDDVYRCRSVPALAHGTDPHGRRWDFAFIELDRPVVPPRRPAPVVPKAVATDDLLTVIGYPDGLPVKIDPAARVLDPRTGNDDYFTMASDTFEASSGSGVFDADGDLVGVFVRGGIDRQFRSEERCFASRRVTAPDPAKAEHASYVAQALSCLCAAGWESETLCPEHRSSSGPCSSRTTTPSADAGCVMSPTSRRSRWTTSILLVLALTGWNRRRSS